MLVMVRTQSEPKAFASPLLKLCLHLGGQSSEGSTPVSAKRYAINLGARAQALEHGDRAQPCRMSEGKQGLAECLAKAGKPASRIPPIRREAAARGRPKCDPKRIQSLPMALPKAGRNKNLGKKLSKTPNGSPNGSKMRSL